MKLKSKDDIILSLIISLEAFRDGRIGLVNKDILQGKIETLKWVLGIKDSNEIAKHLFPKEDGSENETS